MKKMIKPKLNNASLAILFFICLALPSSAQSFGTAKTSYTLTVRYF